MIDLLNLTAGERIDLADLQFATQDSILAAHRNVPESFLTDSGTQPGMWIVRGFTMSNPTGQVLQVNSGVALLALRQGTRILQGVLAAEAPANSAIDLSSYAAATYGVFIRFVTQRGSYDTRTFWRQSSGGQEYSQSVPTRLTGTWEVAVQAALPGAEWLQIGQVTAPTMATVDMRPLYFEGRVDQATSSGWGSAQDRDPGRGAAGITNLQTALAALRQSVEDIKGPGISRWYTDHVAGQSIGYLSSALQAGRTSWADDQFYAQGSAQAPRLTFGADGANLTYRRSAGLLLAQGPALGSGAGAATTAFGVSSGTDDAQVRLGFFRNAATTGPAGIDATLTRSQALGGVGLYGSAGRMGGAGVGLGYSLGNTPPALFVGATNSVGVGLPSAAGLIADSTLLMQFATASGQQRFLSFNDGGAAKVQLGFINQVAAPNQTSFYGAALAMQGNTPLAFLQNAQDVGLLRGGQWTLGVGSLAAGANGILPTQSTLTVASAPVVITDQGVNPLFGPFTTYAQTTSLQVNNSGQSSTLYGVNLAARISLSNNSPVFHIDGSTSFFAVRDAMNGSDVLNYSAIGRNLTIPVLSKISAVQATNGSTGAYAFVPAVQHTDTYLGCCGTVTLGTVTTSLGTASILGALSFNGGASYVLPVRASSGQTLQSFNFRFMASISAGGQASVAFKRWDTSSRGDNTLFQTTVNIPANSSTPINVTGNLNNESSTPLNGWYLQVSMSANNNSTSPYIAYFESTTVVVTTPSLNPQHQ